MIADSAASHSLTGNKAMTNHRLSHAICFRQGDPHVLGGFASTLDKSPSLFSSEMEHRQE